MADNLDPDDQFAADRKPDRKLQFLIGMLVFFAFLVVGLGAILAIRLAGVPLQGPLAQWIGAAQPGVVQASTGQWPAPAGWPKAPTATNPTPTASPPAVPTPAAAWPVGPKPVAVAVAPASAEAGGTCGQTGSMTILFSGVDFAGGTWPEGADAIRLIKVNFDRQKIAVVAFPRDLWVRASGLAGQDIPESRLGMVYYYTEESTVGSEREQAIAATTAVAQALYDNFDLAPQHYFTMQMANVAEMVDTLGGVEVIVPEAFASDHEVTFPAGAQMLDGKLALEYVRTYQPGGDELRLLRQNQFLWGVQKKIARIGILANLPALIEEFNRVVVTDLSPAQMHSLACMAERVPVERIGLFKIDGEMVSPRETGEPVPVLVPNADLIRTRLSEWLEE